MADFNSDGTYNRTTWSDGDTITAEKMNKIESAIYTVSETDIEHFEYNKNSINSLDERVTALESNGSTGDTSGETSVDLSNYYTKSEVYNKTEVNTLISANSGGGTSTGAKAQRFEVFEVVEPAEGTSTIDYSLTITGTGENPNGGIGGFVAVEYY